jgi:hypothetical protein
MMEEMMNIKLKEMSEGIKSGQEEMTWTVNAFRCGLEDVNHKTQNLHKELSDKIEKKHRQNYRQ